MAQGYWCLGIDKDEDALDRLRHDLRADGGDRVELLEADLLADDEIALGALDAIGGEQIQLTLVNNLGGSAISGTQGSSPESHTWESFAQVLAFNLKPLHRLTQQQARVGIILKRMATGG